MEEAWDSIAVESFVLVSTIQYVELTACDDDDDDDVSKIADTGEKAEEAGCEAPKSSTDDVGGAPIVNSGAAIIAFSGGIILDDHDDDDVSTTELVVEDACAAPTNDMFTSRVAADTFSDDDDAYEEESFDKFTSGNAIFDEMADVCGLLSTAGVERGRVDSEIAAARATRAFRSGRRRAIVVGGSCGSVSRDNVSFTTSPRRRTRDAGGVPLLPPDDTTRLLNELSDSRANIRSLVADPIALSCFPVVSTIPLLFDCSSGLAV